MDLINRNKNPIGFQLLDFKDSARREQEAIRGRSGTVPVNDPTAIKEQNKGLMGFLSNFSNKK